jgi:hypothetical protein
MTKTQWSVASFASGMLIGALGWIANDSTKANAAKFGVPGIVIGITLIVAGLIGMFIFSNKK